MGDPSSPEIRIGDVDRVNAQRLLAEHLTAGRLSPEEYGDRATQAAAARTQGDLLRLFLDLPAPRPNFDAPRQVDEYTPPPAPPPISYEPQIAHPPAKRGPSTWMVAAVTVPIIALGVIVTILGTFGSGSFVVGLVVVGVVLLLLFGGG